MSKTQLLYKAIALFLKKEVDSGHYSSEISESLEVAKQCLESAFSFTVDANQNIPDLLALLESSSKVSATKAEPTEEVKTMAETLKNQGNHCMKEEKFEEAVACYTKAIEMWPTNAVYYSNRAAAYSRLDQQTKAIEDCQKALTIDPKYSKAYGRMGIAYSSLGDYAMAVESYRKGLELDPTNENCQQNLALAEERLRENAGGAGAEANSTGGFDFGALLNNPMMQNMACQLMRDPNTQNLMANLFRNAFSGNTETETNTANVTPTTAPQAATESTNPPTETDGSQPNMDQFLRLGQQLAQQLRANNPQLVEQLRQTFHDTVPSDGSTNSGDPKP
ncbi:unnamed protein product [Calicophoron daubneyi]|uniref:SGTA homodimerisation domain-containing protein n=1 Tax=Calicophoron daubneyi TaxID=300641 RepID=A0AAV2TJB1_CALDB